MNPVVIGFAATAATLLLSILLFSADLVYRVYVRRREASREMVARVLDTLDEAARLLIRPPVARLWSNSEVEYALLLPRLLLDLGPKNQVIAVWVHRQIQLMMLEPSGKKALRVKARVAEKLIQWQQRTLKREWFEHEVGEDAPATEFVVPFRIKLSRAARDSWAWFQFFAVFSSVAVLLRKVTTR
ncbi:MAG: hypothetical protein ACSHW9_04475 [Salinibacterium amurskyense]